MFPISLPTCWLAAQKQTDLNASPSLIRWMKSEDSLTARVKTLGDDFSIEVLNQSFIGLSADQQQALNTRDRMALVREVTLKIGDLPQIYAQTLIPESTLISTNQRLAELGNSSLGDLLFNNPNCQRGEIQLAQVTETTALGQFINEELQQIVGSDTYIRRSLFILNDKPLLVNECFLPELVTQLAKQDLCNVATDA